MFEELIFENITNTTTYINLIFDDGIIINYPLYILVINSKYFSALYTSNMSEMTTMNIIINNIDSNNMIQILDHLMLNNLILNYDNIEYILEISYRFLITKLIDKCVCFIKYLRDIEYYKLLMIYSYDHIELYITKLIYIHEYSRNDLLIHLCKKNVYMKQ